MKLINPDVKVWNQTYNLKGIFEHIERCARVCYASKHNAINSKKFIDGLIDKGHLSPLQHGTIYLKCPGTKYLNSYSKVVTVNGNDYVTTNYLTMLRGSYKTDEDAIRNNFNKSWFDDLKYMCEPTEFHNKRTTACFTTSIGISREFNRHVTHSICEQSTRYCNYSKDRFDNQITFIKPSWYATNRCTEWKDEFKKSLNESENRYLRMIELGAKPQDAREILPLSTATILIHTAYDSDWKHFFNMRCTSSKYGIPHPDAAFLADKLKQIMFNE